MVGIAEIDLGLPEQQHPQRPVEAVAAVAEDFQPGFAHQCGELLLAEHADVVGFAEVFVGGEVFLQVFRRGMRHAEQIECAGLADPHQLGEELPRIVDVLDDLGGDHPGGRGVSQGQRVAVADQAFQFAGRGIGQALAGPGDLFRVDVGDDDASAAHGAEMNVAAVAAPHVEHGVLGGNRKAAEQLVGLLVEPAAEHRVAQPEHVRVDRRGGGWRGDGLGGGAGRRDDLLEEVQHEVAPEVVATRRAALRRLTRREPRSRQGLSTKR